MKACYTCITKPTWHFQYFWGKKKKVKKNMNNYLPDGRIWSRSFNVIHGLGGSCSGWTGGGRKIFLKHKLFSCASKISIIYFIMPNQLVFSSAIVAHNWLKNLIFKYKDLAAKVSLSRPKQKTHNKYMKRTLGNSLFTVPLTQYLWEVPF